MSLEVICVEAIGKNELPFSVGDQGSPKAAGCT